MDNTIIIYYCVIAVLLAVVDFYFGYLSFKQPEKSGRFFGFTCISAGIVTLAYLFSIRAHDYFINSVASSIYFIMIDWMLVSLVHFVYLFTSPHKFRGHALIRKLTQIYAAFDTVVLIVNIFYEIAVHYDLRKTLIAFYTYDMKPLYYLHLLFTYVLVLLVLTILLIKAIRTPRQYRIPYMLNIAAIAFIVLINAVFLFDNERTILSLIDHSIIGYSLGIYLMYWAAFRYRKNDMLKSLSMTIFQNIGQGIVLFDYENALFMHNEKAERMLGDINFHGKMLVPEFLEAIRLPQDFCTQEKQSIQVERKSSEGLPLRCDFSRLRDDRGTVLGNLFVLTETANDVDFLTGFLNADRFRRFAAENPYNFNHPTTAVMFDILGLGEINRVFGREVGDQRIRNLVKVMKQNMPSNTFFVRGYEAHLIAVCFGKNEADLVENVEKIIEACDGTVLYGMSTTVEPSFRISPSGRSMMNLPESRNILATIDTAGLSLQIKKLLIEGSAHSQTLSSLVRALQESDSDTEAHVHRTQRMGQLLGNRIGLCDAELAQLNLLCLLHDIGKIGIPLEILNKPGKLTEEEWAVLRTHPEKGYQIAMSSNELKSIAEMILSHHERWDGHGYPNRLEGQNIPILSRIISIVDAYDAMVNNRVYRKALSPAEAQAEIRRCAGNQFDPYLAEEFLSLLKESPDLGNGVITGGEEESELNIDFGTAPETGDTVPVMHSTYILDANDYIAEIDDAFTDLTGYTASDAVGRMSQYELVPKEDRAFYLLQVNNQFAHGNIALLEHEIVRKDGERIRVLCYGKRYFDSAAKMFRSEVLITRVTKS